MSSINPFRKLLNFLNSELTQRDVESLKHVCGIPAGEGERINTGWDLFNILIHQDKIGEELEKMKFLLRIIKELKPKRKKLVSMIKKHIHENCEQPPETISLLMADMESSSESYQTTPRPPTPEFADNCCCSFRHGWLMCNCNPCCSRWCCCVILAIMFSFLFVMAALACYTNIFPHVTASVHSKQDLSEVTLAVIIILGFFACCCISYVICRLCTMHRRNSSVYSDLRSIDGTDSMSNPVAASYTTSNSMRTSCLSYTERKTYCPKCSIPSSGHITASSSFASSMGTPEFEAVSDGCSQQDVFAPVFEAEDRYDDKLVAREV